MTLLLDPEYRRQLAEQLLIAANRANVRVWVIGPEVITVKVIGRDRRYGDAPMRWCQLVFELAPEFVQMAGRPVRGRVAELRAGGCVVSRDGRACLDKMAPPDQRAEPANAA